MKILLLNGPNLDRLGHRQPEIYGTRTLPEIVADLRAQVETAGSVLEDLQSGEAQVLVERVRAGDADAIVINPASLTHHERSLAEALAAFPGPVIEVHISNIAAREPYRRRSLVAPAVTGSIVGLGVAGYRLAIDALLAEERA